MERIIKTVSGKHRAAALDFVERVFAEHDSAREGRFVRRLTEEIRAGRYHVPELELMMADETDEIIGYAMFSRFPLEGKHENELLLLTPVAVKTELQRRHISRDLLEYGMQKAAGMGFRVAIVEGDPRNYRARGFETAADHGILPGPTVHLPHIDCLMAAPLVPGGLDGICGTVDYSLYPCLLEEGE